MDAGANIEVEAVTNCVVENRRCCGRKCKGEIDTSLDTNHVKSAHGASSHAEYQLLCKEAATAFSTLMCNAYLSLSHVAKDMKPPNSTKASILSLAHARDKSVERWLTIASANLRKIVEALIFAPIYKNMLRGMWKPLEPETFLSSPKMSYNIPQTASRELCTPTCSRQKAYRHEVVIEGSSGGWIGHTIK